MARILVTGAAGFIGRALCPELAARGHGVVAAVRGAAVRMEGADSLPLGALGPRTEWASTLDDIEIVIHLAQRAHRKGAEFAAEPETAANLARAAAKAGVRRLVYLSSVKAMGDFIAPAAPFRPDSEPRPQDAYGRSKLATERALALVPEIETVTIRPPLVYGPGVGANFRALMRLVAVGMPLPFAGVDNRRSLVFLGNLVDLIARAATHPAAAGQVLLVRDGVDLSTPALVAALAQGLGRRVRLFRVPAAALALGRAVPGLGPALARLTLSAQIDDAATRTRLGWTPPISAEAGLAATAAAYRAG